MKATRELVFFAACCMVLLGFLARECGTRACISAADCVTVCGSSGVRRFSPSGDSLCECRAPSIWATNAGGPDADAGTDGGSP